MRIVEEPTCDCGGACDSASDSGDGTVVKVMGPGCKNFHQLHENALKAVERIGRPIKVEYVTDLAEVAAAGVMSTPALLVDGKVVSAGKVLSPAEIQKMLR